MRRRARAWRVDVDRSHIAQDGLRFCETIIFCVLHTIGFAARCPSYELFLAHVLFAQPSTAMVCRVTNSLSAEARKISL